MSLNACLRCFTVACSTWSLSYVTVAGDRCLLGLLGYVSDCCLLRDLVSADLSGLLIRRHTNITFLLQMRLIFRSRDPTE